ncbi:hypothetical protein BDY21DRAFT_46489 [Lineolata rhizophorae]|uniref:Uncharacterized protein n=1 Tax=Lineolata rhizophorae TaxID=578093 RepID=A0A6A6NZ04_9PEZI|nr:hypothetical protein BDY21DRAFT_46489 [Lineolata rhizophorae]
MDPDTTSRNIFFERVCISRGSSKRALICSDRSTIDAGLRSSWRSKIFNGIRPSSFTASRSDMRVEVIAEPPEMSQPRQAEELSLRADTASRRRLAVLCLCRPEHTLIPLRNSSKALMKSVKRTPSSVVRHFRGNGHPLSPQLKSPHGQRPSRSSPFVASPVSR